MDITKLDEIKKLANDIASGRCGNYASKAQWYGAINKAAEAQREPDETREMAFSRFVTGDTDGRAMFKAYKSAGGADYAAPTPAAEPIAKINPANAMIRALAEELMAADPNLDKLDALRRVHAERPDLGNAAKVE